MSTYKDHFQQLFDHSKKRALLCGVTHLIEWDQETFMPPKAAHNRSEQIELLVSLSHEMLIDSHFIDTLSTCIDLETGKLFAKNLEPWQQAALREWRRDVNKARALPTEFVKAFAKLCSQSLEVWKEAKQKSDFSLFAPYLKKIVKMNKEKAQRLGYDDHPYDALLDEYEPGLTTQKLNHLFPKIGREVSALLKKIKKAPQVETEFLKQKVSDEKQLEFGKLLLEAIGHTQENGRLDLSAHPFSSSSHPTDSRLTTRITKHNIFDNIGAVMHEGGHGLYERGLNPKYFGTPVGSSLGLGMHESQSRLYETRVGQSKAFWKYFLPKLKKAYGGTLNDVSVEMFYKGINRVVPSLTRVEADEVTYPLHVIVRFEIEKELINGKMNVDEVPEAWNFLMKTLLGITPKTDSEGCMQDIHWSMGAIGYFPTYLVGSIRSAQIFAAFEAKYKDWESRVAKGELLFIRDWLQNEIHQWGMMYPAEELMERVCKAPEKADPYLDYLKNKYTEIYRL
jgi:carboxypeptidase Taq